MPTFSELDLLTSPLDPGLTVIEASAGTGKTYSISHLVPRLLLEGTLPDLSKLLLVTFTKDAARELSDRVRRVLMLLTSPAAETESVKNPHVAALRPLLADPSSRTRLEKALLDLDLLAVSTIHSCCQKTLQQEGSLCGIPVLPEVISDDKELLETIVRELWVRTLTGDTTIAALSTSNEWQIGDARDFINARRRALSPVAAPVAPDFTDLLRDLRALCSRLASASLFDPTQTLLSQVVAWNKGYSTSEVLDQLRGFSSNATDRIEYWEAVAFASSVSKLVTARKKDAKDLKARIEQDQWILAINELQGMIGILEWSWQHQLAAEALPLLEDKKLKLRLITLDGLIGALFQALHRSGDEGGKQSAILANRLAERYHVALIDESQDTDPRQFAIFKRIFLDAAPRRRLILVGDPKQAIYGFRGADLGTYLRARAGADSGYTLTHTYRAPKPLVSAVNSLFARDRAFHNPDMQFKAAQSALPFDRQLFRQGKPCSRIETWVAPNTDGYYATSSQRVQRISTCIASTIVDLLKNGELRKTFSDGRESENTKPTPSDFAVLVATHLQANAMASALQARSVPAVINSGSDVFASEEAKELHTVLLAVLEPRRRRLLRGALATRLMGLDSLQLSQLDDAGGEGNSGYVVWLDRFMHWGKIWTQRGLSAFLAELEQSGIEVTHRLALTPLIGERKATNYRQLTDLLLGASREVAPRPSELARWLGQQISQAEGRTDAEDRQLQLSTDREAVQIVTMHKAKGLEYPLVFCPYLADSLKEGPGFATLPGIGATDPDTLANLRLMDDVGRAAYEQRLAEAQLEERLRLAYVAITRAQVRVWTYIYSTYPKFDLGSPLDWLLRSEGELGTQPTYSAAWIEQIRGSREAHHIDTLLKLGAKSEVPETLPDGAAAADLTFRDPPTPSDETYQPNTPADKSAVPIVLIPLNLPEVPQSWRITSFSSLTKEKHAHGTPLPPPDATEPPAPTGGESGDIDAIAFLGAPGGATVGTVVHEWIEAWDFSVPTDKEVARHITSSRLPATKEGLPGWKPVLVELFKTVREIRLPGGPDAPLHLLCPDAHGSEWHFHLPLSGRLSARRLAQCFAEHAAIEHRPYAALLAGLSDEEFDGLLQGFIDRLVRRGPVWGVIDWKTNHLGSSLSDYDTKSLLECAMEAHYLLQAHLYVFALRRYLRTLGIERFTVAGAWLVFLRAIAPGETRGVLHINPSEEMLDALEELFAPAKLVIP